jgi:ClpP class serine protease
MNRFFYIDRLFLQNLQAAKDEKRPVPEGRNWDKFADKKYAAESLAIENGRARINVTGVLLESADAWDDLLSEYGYFDFTTYEGLTNQIEAAEANPYVDAVDFYFDTPGGSVAGVDGAAMAIRNMKKESRVIVGFYCCSAGYYLASQADSIVASAPSSTIGSIGVVVSLVDTTEMWAKYGVKFYDITSTNAPEKRKPAHSDEYKQQIREQLDGYHEVFARRVAEGRSGATGKEVTSDLVNETYGRGGVMLADKAISVGMIDGILESETVSVKTTEENMAEEKDPVEMQEQLAEAQAKGKTEGVSAERERVQGFLAWADVDMDRVAKAIEDGEEMSASFVKEMTAKARESAVVPGAAAEEMAGEQPTAVSAPGAGTSVEEQEPAGQDDVADFNARVVAHSKHLK